ncbi:MAG: NYN domain-containing protein [Zavarzinella sp.]
MEQFLIDGYNLLHAIGTRIDEKAGQSGLHRAREEMLSWIADHLSGKQWEIRIVFDAQNSYGGARETTRFGMRVIVVHGSCADSYIEEELSHLRTPEKWTVVSNDRRVRDAAHIHGARQVRCQGFVDLLLSNPPPADELPADIEKEIPDTSPELEQELLAAFSQKSQPHRRNKRTSK